MKEQTQAAEAQSLEQQLAAAEERGYLRGLNEQIAAKMNEPGMWENPDEEKKPKEPERGFRILASARQSIWGN